MRYRLLLMILVGILVACTSTAPPSTPAQSGRATDRPFHLVVAVRGTARLSRQGWKEDTTVPLSFGTSVRAGDLIRADGSAQVTVVCANLEVVSVRPGASGVPCPEGAATMHYTDRSIIAPRGSNVPPEIPQIIAPRGSDVLDPHPLLRWRAVPGVDRYTISIAGIEWRQDVQGVTELHYPDDAPPLQSGQTYKLLVVAGTHSSDEERETGMGFIILPDAQAAPIHQSVQTINTLGLDPDATDLLLANLYRSSNLYAEAIDRLEALTARTSSPTLWRQLGDLYMQVRLPDLAALRYQAVLDHTTSDDLENQALARLALGELADAAGDRDQVREELTAALNLFTLLNDRDGISRAEQMIGHIQSVTPSP